MIGTMLVLLLALLLVVPVVSQQTNFTCEAGGWIRSAARNCQADVTLLELALGGRFSFDCNPLHIHRSDCIAAAAVLTARVGGPVCFRCWNQSNPIFTGDTDAAWISLTHMTGNFALIGGTTTEACTSLFEASRCPGPCQPGTQPSELNCESIVWRLNDYVQNTLVPTASPAYTPTTLLPTREPSKTPTIAPASTQPSAGPTRTPSRHACDDGSHACDSTEVGICTPLISPSSGYRCSCVNTHRCSDGDCNTRGHTCVPITEVPTQSPSTIHPTVVPTSMPTTSEPTTSTPTNDPTISPTQLPTQVPTGDPTDSPTQLPTQVPTFVPTQIPTHIPTSAPSTDTPPQSNSNGEESSSSNLKIIVGFAVMGTIIVVLAAALWQRSKREPPPAVPPENGAAISNPSFTNPEYAEVDHDNVGNLPPQIQRPQYDEVGVVRDQYVDLDPDHLIYNTRA